MKKIAVLIPCFNEEHTVKKVIHDIKSCLPQATVYVYDNNSTDRTAQIAASSGAVVRKEYRQGKGNVMRSMFRDIEADCFVMIDGDDTYPVDNIPEMIEQVLERQADMVVGDRLTRDYYKMNTRPFHNLGNRMIKGLINKLFHSELHDILSGLRAFSPLFVKSFPVLSKDFEIETEMTIHALDKNFLIRQVPIAYRERPAGSFSKLNTWKDGYKALRTIFMLFREYQPILFFGFIALLLTLISIGLFFPVFNEYLHTGLVRRFPTLIVSGILMLAALQCLSAGMRFQ